MFRPRSPRSETNVLCSFRLECCKWWSEISWMRFKSSKVSVFGGSHPNVRMSKANKEIVVASPLPRRQRETWEVSCLTAFREIFFHFIVPLIPFSWYPAAYSRQRSRYVPAAMNTPEYFSTWVAFPGLIIAFILSGTFPGESVFWSTFNNGFGEHSVLCFEKLCSVFNGHHKKMKQCSSSFHLDSEVRIWC